MTDDVIFFQLPADKCVPADKCSAWLKFLPKTWVPSLCNGHKMDAHYLIAISLLFCWDPEDYLNKNPVNLKIKSKNSIPTSKRNISMMCPVYKEGVEICGRAILRRISRDMKWKK